ncbi:MAG: hypothetical protein WCJ58_06745 [bacterium]
MSLISESYLTAAQKNLLLCRPGDWNHAKRVAKWVEELAVPELSEKELLLKAAYIHDIGWREIFPGNKSTITKAELLKFEPQANANSVPFVTEFLTKLKHSTQEINTILSYIKAADLHQSQNAIEAIIVDADSLSKLNIDHLQEKFAKKSWQEVYQLFDTELPKRIQTVYAKKVFPGLLQKLKSEIQAAE